MIPGLSRPFAIPRNGEANLTWDVVEAQHRGVDRATDRGLAAFRIPPTSVGPVLPSYRRARASSASFRYS